MCLLLAAKFILDLKKQDISHLIEVSMCIIFVYILLLVCKHNWYIVVYHCQIWRLLLEPFALVSPHNEMLIMMIISHKIFALTQ